MSYFSIRAVSKKYGKQQALKSFSTELKKGDILAIVGESGSGKSTLLRIMAALEAQTKGEVWLGDRKIDNPKEKLVAGYDEIKLIHQDYALYPNSTVEENISRPLLSFDENYTRNRVEELISLLRLGELRDKLPRQLSGGQQQKVAIAKAMSVEPEILLLDEPFSSLDSIQTRKIMDELKEVFTALGTTVILVTHDLDDALRLTDDLLILKNGKIIQRGNSKDLCLRPKSKYVAELFSSINRIKTKGKDYIRPVDVKIRTRNGILAHVTDVIFLLHFNSLKVKIKETGEIWEVEDPDRKYHKGDRVYLTWEQGKVLNLKS